jgi:hypothetical protein
MCEFLGFRCGAVDVFAALEHGAAVVDELCQTFRDNLVFRVGMSNE